MLPILSLFFKPTTFDTSLLFHISLSTFSHSLYFSVSAYGRNSGFPQNFKIGISECSSPHLTSNKEPSVVQDQFKWTIYNATVNLPAVLNDPRLAKRETDFFTKTWGESFEKRDISPSPYLPEVNRSHFEKYLNKSSEVICLTSSNAYFH